MEERAAMPCSLTGLTPVAGSLEFEEWRLAQSVRANVLIMCCAEAVRQLTATLGSAAVWYPGRPLYLHRLSTPER
jgi:hypothetical protein